MVGDGALAGRMCLESLPILLPWLVRRRQGRPAAHPMATGGDKELLDRAAGAPLPRPERSESLSQGQGGSAAGADTERTDRRP